MHRFGVSIDNAFDFLSGEYAGLFASSSATAFQHPLWLARLYAGLAPRQGAQPLVIVVREGERLVLVLPLVRRRYRFLSVIEFADLGVSDYGGAVANPADFAALLQDRAACARIRAALRPYDLLRLNKQPDGGLDLGALLGAPPATPMDINAYPVELAETFAEWRARAIGESYRRELDKKLRQFERKGAVTFECVTDPERLGEVFERMRDYRRLRFDGREGRDFLQSDAFYDFYTAVAEAGVEGVARTYAYRVDGEPVACAFGLSVERRFLVLLGGFDYPRFKNQSLGALMFQRVAEDCIARGDTVLDFTIGDEPYKTTFGARPQPMWTLTRAGTPLGWLAAQGMARMPQLLKRLASSDGKPAGDHASVAAASP